MQTKWLKLKQPSDLENDKATSYELYPKSIKILKEYTNTY